MKHAIDFGKVLKSVRKGKRITQEVLADTCGLDRTYIGLMERGKRSPTLETLCKLSVGLNVLPSDLLAHWENTLALRWNEHVHMILAAVMNSREPKGLRDMRTDMQDIHMPVQIEPVFSPLIVERITRIVLIDFLRTHIRRNTACEKAGDSEAVRSELILLLADETLGLTAEQNQHIVNLIINMLRGDEAEDDIEDALGTS